VRKPAGACLLGGLHFAPGNAFLSAIRTGAAGVRPLLLPGDRALSAAWGLG